MKHFRLIFILTVAWTCRTEAQSTFQNIIDAGTSFKLNITPLPSQNYLVGIGWARGISRMDAQGNVLETHSYWSDTLSGIGGIRRYSDNEYVFASSYRKNTCILNGSAVLGRYPVIGKIDSLGNILAVKHYTLGQACSNGAGDLVVTNDRGLVSWGYEWDFNLLKVDSLLQPVWARNFPNIGGFQFVKELPGGDLLAGINMDTAGAAIARIDPDGTFIWCKSYIRPRGMVSDAIILSDSSFIIIGYTDSTASTNIFEPMPPSYQPKLFMLKLDGDGQSQWCKGYHSDSNLWYVRRGCRIERTADGNYAVLSTMGYPQFNQFHRIFFMKLDNNGDTLWTHSSGLTGYDYYSKELLACTDGGFLLTGFIWGDLPGASGLPYIYKTDPQGHFTCGEAYHPVSISELFPVDSSFTISSIDGATALPAFVADTIFDPITIYDGCTFTTGLPPSYLRARPRPVSIRPNPNTGQFTVQFADPLMAESYYSVYDVLGKLLYQRPLPAGQTTQEVDLSRYGQGTYVIKCTAPDGVWVERVVVE